MENSHNTFPRNRYSGPKLLAALDTAAVRVASETCVLTLEIEPETEIELYLPALKGACSEPWRARARALLSDLSALDNLVQESCESEWARSNALADSYELDLSWIELSPAGLILCYVGAKVNTDWEARFQWTGRRWEKENF